MATKMTKQDQQWQAESDARTMAQYQEILSDKARMSRAIKEANKQKVVEVLDYCNKVMPVPQIPYTTANIMMARTYLELGETQRALKIIDVMKETSIQYLEWISAMDPVNQRASMDEFSEKFSIFAEILHMNQTILKNDVEQDLALYDKYMGVYRKWNKQ